MSASTGSPKLPILKKETKSAASSLFTKTDSKLNSTLSFINQLENDVESVLFGVVTFSAGLLLGLWIAPAFNSSLATNSNSITPRLVRPNPTAPKATPAVYQFPITPASGAFTAH